MRLDHVGIVVADLDRALQFHVETLGLRESFRETVDEHRVEIAGLFAGESYVELVRPLCADSPLVRFLGRSRSRLHHIAYGVADVGAELRRYAAAGVHAIDDEPRRGARGCRVAFLQPGFTEDVLVELCQPGEDGERPF